MIGFSGMFDAILLIALGIGYIVLYLAKREEKELQVTGYIIGSMIIILALLYTLGDLWMQARMYPAKMRYYQGMTQQHMMPQAMPKVPVEKPPVPK